MTTLNSKILNFNRTYGNGIRKKRNGGMFNDDVEDFDEQINDEEKKRIVENKLKTNQEYQRISKRLDELDEIINKLDSEGYNYDNYSAEYHILSERLAQIFITEWNRTEHIRRGRFAFVSDPVRRGNGRRKKAAGIMDVIKDPLGTVTEAFRSVPSRLNNISTRTLQQYGNLYVIGINLARTPLNKYVSSAINAVSLGQFGALQQKYGYDTMYHLSLIATLSGGMRILIEKNEVINIEPASQASSINNQTQYLTLNIEGHRMTLESMINNTRDFMGETAFYSYSGLKNNCQNFIQSILQSNNLLTQQANTFLYQDVTGIRKELPSYVEKSMDGLTNLGSFFSRLSGKGKKKGGQKLKIDPYFIDHVTRHGFSFL